MEKDKKYYKQAPDKGSWSKHLLFQLSEEIC